MILFEKERIEIESYNYIKVITQAVDKVKSQQLLVFK